MSTELEPTWLIQYLILRQMSLIPGQLHNKARQPPYRRLQGFDSLVGEALAGARVARHSIQWVPKPPSVIRQVNYG